ncbi:MULTISPECIES: hypothetical protein [unclassified Novosphingobium]|uniref:hypothetical protein n=1 Tax=unclassified Novosphingobium TaxID=2644732 RepID=UPI001F3242AB|nr:MULTISPECIES: hypothetical protein [unclassified Novosphingobium]
MPCNTLRTPSPHDLRQDDESPVAPARPQRGPWLRLLAEMLQLAGGSAQFLLHTEKAWSSATFTGSRHVIVLEFNGVEGILHGEAYVAALPEHEFTIVGQLVADAAVIAVEHHLAPHPRMTVEAQLLLLEDC